LTKKTNLTVRITSLLQRNRIDIAKLLKYCFSERQTIL